MQKQPHTMNYRSFVKHFHKNTVMKNDHIHRRQLKRIYILVVLLTVFMCLWILILPATAFQKKNSTADSGSELKNISSSQTAFHIERQIESNILPPEIWTKYKNEDLVVYTHILPSLFWILAIPIQFHQSLQRGNFKVLHKYLGRLFVATSLLIVIGFFIILKKKLTYEHFLKETKPIMIPGIPFLSMADALLVLVAGYFAATIIISINYARNHKIASHREWMIRHCSVGLGVAMQKFLSLMASPTVTLVYGSMFLPEYLRARMFFFIGMIGNFVCVALGEYTIWLLRHSKQMDYTKVDVDESLSQVRVSSEEINDNQGSLKTVDEDGLM